MGALPLSTSPGLHRIHQRALSALDRCEETQSVDFKESAPWNVLKPKIIKTAMAMANLRDGGLILVGVSERDTTWRLSGIESAHLETYDPDVVVDQVNKHASPWVDLSLVLLEHESLPRFLIVDVREFRDTPVVCRNSLDRMLEAGAFYVRPPGKPQTTRVTSAEDMHELLNLATAKRTRAFLQAAREVGLREPREADQQRFERQLEGL